jgi:hypothetical protein
VIERFGGSTRPRRHASSTISRPSLRASSCRRVTASTCVSTDLIERSFVEERRPTKVIPRFTEEKSVMKLNSRRSSEHRSGWCRVSINDLERQLLRLLRRELGSTLRRLERERR